MSTSIPPETTQPKVRERLLSPFIVVLGLVLIILGAVALILYFQVVLERNLTGVSGPKDQYEAAKLAAEVSQIRSDISGSLFGLKVLGLFVTIGGVVSAYLLGQRENTKKQLAFEEDKEKKRLAFEEDKEQKRLEFEHNKDVDAAYQLIVQGLSEENALLRATAAVKLGAILKSFPTEWNVTDERQRQMIRLTKEILAAALALENDPKVLKTLTIALVLHKPSESSPSEGAPAYADATYLDLSEARADEAFWSKVDFSHTDFYKASLARTSFRRSILDDAHFYLTDLSNAKLAEARGERTILKLCDLRNADFTEASLVKPNFEGAHVFEAILHKASIEDPEHVKVDMSEDGDGSNMVDVKDWIEASKNGKTEGGI